MRKTLKYLLCGFIFLSCLSSQVIPAYTAKTSLEKLTFLPLQFNPPSIQKISLSDGPQIYFYQDKELPLVEISVLIKTGQVFEPITKKGLVPLFFALMNRPATKHHSKQEINILLEQLAAEWQIDFGMEFATAKISFLEQDLEKGLALLAELLTQTVFSPEDLVNNKISLIQSLKQEEESPFDLAYRYFKAFLYGTNHPYGWYSQAESINSVALSDIYDFQKMYFTPANMSLAISGNFNRDQATALLVKYFSGGKSQSIPKLAEPLAANPGIHIYFIDKPLKQSTILIGSFGIKRYQGNPDYFPFLLLNEILGGGSFTSRLYQEIRERRGLAYAVGSYFDTADTAAAGKWLAYSQTRTDKTIEVTRLMLKVINDLKTARVEESELNLYKESIINSQIFRFQSGAQIASQAMIIDYIGLEKDYLQSYPQKVREVTAAQIQETATKYFNFDDLFIVIIGDKSHFDVTQAQLAAFLAQGNVNNKIIFEDVRLPE